MMPLILDDKARESLEAAERLLQDDEGRECLPNAVTNRAYYAAYLAVAHVAQRLHVPFTDGRKYYRHDMLPDLARRRGFLGVQDAIALHWLLSQRVMADYTDESVDFDDANKAVETAKLLLERLIP